MMVFGDDPFLNWAPVDFQGRIVKLLVGILKQKDCLWLLGFVFVKMIVWGFYHGLHHQ